MSNFYNPHLKSWYGKRVYVYGKCPTCGRQIHNFTGVILGDSKDGFLAVQEEGVDYTYLQTVCVDAVKEMPLRSTIQSIESEAV